MFSYSGIGTITVRKDYLEYSFYLLTVRFNYPIVRKAMFTDKKVRGGD